MRPSLPSPVAVFVALGFAALWVPNLTSGQGTLEDYRRANALETRYAGLVSGVVDQPRWSQAPNGSAQLTFRRSTLGGTFEFVQVDPATGTQAAFTPSTSGGEGTTGAGGGGSSVAAARRAPGGQFEATIEDHNLVVRWVGATSGDRAGTVHFRTHDGTEGSRYTLNSVSWAPDGQRLMVYRVVAGYERLVHYVESSPQNQLQPRHFTRVYTKPGDRLAVSTPVLIDVESGVARDIPADLFPDPYTLSNPRWRDDGREVHFEYNERGHRVFRVLGVNPVTGAVRAIVNEETDSFFYYRPTSATGKYVRRDLDDGREILWMSERSGWSHLYLLDGETGRVKHTVTSGPWVVRDVLRVDEAARQVWFLASGMDRDQDPYFTHLFRVNLDGSGLVRVTHEDATHEASFSPEGDFIVVTRSRLDLPPITDLHDAQTGARIAELGRGDHSALLEAGWTPPEVFVAKGRDGVTDIWGILVRPSNFDPTRVYPVIESIYAGPHDNHVPKAFTVFPPRGMLAQAELGFVVVMIDGMGTSNRSKAFHDVAWMNLRDAGFPDRILWIQAAAERYAQLDLTRVGIYGGSAGGQNAMGALLFHGDFYHAAVADNGCHDNRMDKIWWNELWMGKVGPHYAESSNVVHAHRLRGKLLLTVGELDSNVDPSSTYQVVDALHRAGKEFDFLMIPGGEHARGPIHERKRFDFFVRHFLGVDPPDWNQITEAT